MTRFVALTKDAPRWPAVEESPADRLAEGVQCLSLQSSIGLLFLPLRQALPCSLWKRIKVKGIPATLAPPRLLSSKGASHPLTGSRDTGVGADTEGPTHSSHRAGPLDDAGAVQELRSA